MGGADGFDAVRVLDRELVLAVLRGLPQAVIDDAEFGHLDRDPVLGRVDPGDALSRRGVFDVAQAVPDQTTDIELVIDDAGAALGMAAQGGVGPQGTGRARNALGVETTRQGARADTGGELLEDAAHGLGLILVDAPLAPDRLSLVIGALHHVVAVAEPAAGLALLDTPPQAPMGLGGEVLQEERVHGALQADVKLGDLAFGQGDNPHARESQMFEQGGYVRLVPAHAVQGLGHHQVELAALRVGQDSLDTGSQDHAIAGDGGVLVRGDDLPSFAFRILAADAKLIIDGGLPLLVRRVAGIEGNAGHLIGSPNPHRPPMPGHYR